MGSLLEEMLAVRIDFFFIIYLKEMVLEIQ